MSNKSIKVKKTIWEQGIIKDKSLTILVFLRAPQLGMVKTRLAKSLDKSLILNLYKDFVLDLLYVLKGYNVILYFWPPDEKQLVIDWLGMEYSYIPQKGNSLGEKMSNAFNESFHSGFESAILLGTDIPELDPDIVGSARQSLKKHDAVIGPSNDGGYYLIGFNKDSFSSKIFNNISWSTNKVLSQTLKKMDLLSLNYKLLPVLNDIDTPQDLKSLAKRVKKGSKIGKRTKKNLEALQD